MMNAHVMMLVLASSLFSAMWSSDQPSGRVGQVIANRPAQPHRQPMSADSPRPGEEAEKSIRGMPTRADRAVELPTTGSALPPVRAIPPDVRVGVNAAVSMNISISRNWIASLFQATPLFQTMIGSGPPLSCPLKTPERWSRSVEGRSGDIPPVASQDASASGLLRVANLEIGNADKHVAAQTTD